MLAGTTGSVAASANPPVHRPCPDDPKGSVLILRWGVLAAWTRPDSTDSTRLDVRLTDGAVFARINT